jgi:hypothetical protein
MVVMMAANKKWSDEAVDAEIARLNNSEYVKLARKEKQIKNRRRQYMWTLQYMEARGKQLASKGITAENMEEKLFGGVIEDES